MVGDIKEPISPDEISLDEGGYLVRLAREAVTEFLGRGVKISPSISKESKLWRYGASFVTILKIMGDGSTELRGCIGYLVPIEPLVINVINASPI